ncbi:hypothetical protein AMECASPLE_001853 [Ameca splendens]|uniref:Uncharacterized protein n=1 Tax=Ameca splendens TaxID=208324 RepID=A0ABV0YW41_9TELE
MLRLVLLIKVTAKRMVGPKFPQQNIVQSIKLPVLACQLPKVHSGATFSSIGFRSSSDAHMPIGTWYSDCPATMQPCRQQTGLHCVFLYLPIRRSIHFLSTI